MCASYNIETYVLFHWLPNISAQNAMRCNSNRSNGRFFTHEQFSIMNEGYLWFNHNLTLEQSGSREDVSI
jgi:hypothetical protein